MGRPPSNGGPAFRFTAAEVLEMETILQEHNNTMPASEVLVGLADKFSESADRKGKIMVQMKKVWNWFQNRRYAIRAKSRKNPVKLNISPMPRDDSTPVRSVPPPNQLQLNPNWANLQERLKSHSSKPSRLSNNPESETTKSIVGKRKERSNAEPNNSGICINPLTPVNDDFSVTDAIAMDCEMVGVSQGNKSALGRVTVINKWGNVIYDEFVRPVERVVDFRTQISGIRPRDLKKAKDFRIVQKRVAELIKGRILVGHALRNDFKALLLSHPKKNVRDTSEYPPFLREGYKRALRHLAAEFLNVEIQNGEHCPIEDARAAMLLYQKNRREWEKRVKDQRRLKQKQKKCKPKEKLRDELLES